MSGNDLPVGLKGLAGCGAAMLVSAAPAVAETWVTATTLPYSDTNPRMVAYQIDVESIFTRGSYTYAKGKMSYSPTSELVTAECGKQRLQMGSDRVNPEPYWIKRVNGAWYYDDRDSIIYGKLFEPPNGTLGRWMTGVFDFLCRR